MEFEGRADAEAVVAVWPAPDFSWVEDVADGHERAVSPLAVAPVERSGRFAVEVAPGRYRLVVSAPTAVAQEVLVMARGGRVEAPPVRLQAGRTCRVSLVDAAEPSPALLWPVEEFTGGPGWRPAMLATTLGSGTGTVDLVTVSGSLRPAVASRNRPEVDGPLLHAGCDVRFESMERLRSSLNLAPGGDLGTQGSGSAAGTDPVASRSAESDTQVAEAQGPGEFKSGGGGATARGFNVRGSVRSPVESSGEGALVWVEQRLDPAFDWGRSSALGPLRWARRSPLSPLAPEVSPTNERGHFAHRVPHGQVASRDAWVLAAWAPGRLPARRPLGGRAGIDLALPLAGTIEGRVTDELGLPLVGATVRVVDPPPYRVAGALVTAATTTDQEGQYRLVDLPTHEDLRVEAHKEGFGPVSVGVLLPPTVAAERADFVLVPELWLAGRLCGPDGEPIAGAEVTTVNRDLAYLVHGPPSRWRIVEGITWAVSDAGGRFRLKLPRGRSEGRALVAAASGWVTETRMLPGRATGQTVIDLGAVVLRPGEKLVGRVLGADGRLVVDVQVLYSRAGAEAPPSLPVGSPALLLNPAEAEMAGGDFSIGGLLPGDMLNLQVTADGYLPERVVGLALRDQPVEIVREPGVAVSVRVEDEAGAPTDCSALLMVRLGTSSTGSSGRREACQPGPEQRIVGLAPGDYDLRVSSPETELWQRSVHVSEFEGENAFVARLAPLGAMVHGEVWSESGPLRAVRVWIGRKATESSDDGRFLLRARTGLQTIFAEHPATGRIVSRIVKLVAGENEVGLDLSDRVFSGRVLDAAGAAVVGASVALRSPESVDIYRTLSTADGGFTLSAVPGAYEVAVRSTSGDLEEAVDLRPNSVNGALLRLEALGRLRVRVAGLAPDEEAQVVWSRTPLDPEGAIRYKSGGEEPVVSLAPGRWFFAATGEVTRRRGFDVVDVKVGRGTNVADGSNEIMNRMIARQLLRGDTDL